MFGLWQQKTKTNKKKKKKHKSGKQNVVAATATAAAKLGKDVACAGAAGIFLFFSCLFSSLK